MGRPKSLIKMFQQSVRLPASLIPWLKEESKRAGSFSGVIKELIEDAQNLYELPPNQTERLEAEAERLGMKRRDYIRYVLSTHAERLGAAGDSKPNKAARR